MERTGEREKERGREGERETGRERERGREGETERRRESKEERAAYVRSKIARSILVSMLVFRSLNIMI